MLEWKHKKPDDSEALMRIALGGTQLIVFTLAAMLWLMVEYGAVCGR